jgi:hypothetical protein
LVVGWVLELVVEVVVEVVAELGLDRCCLELALVEEEEVVAELDRCSFLELEPEEAGCLQGGRCCLHGCHPTNSEHHAS